LIPRDQCLAQVLTLVPAQEDLLDQHADHADDGRRDQQRHDPRDQAVGRLVVAAQRESQSAALLLEPAVLHLQRQVAAEQVERTVRHVDDAHQAEDQREAAGDDEEERREREPVERHDGELARVVGALDEQPDDHDGRDREQHHAPRRPAARPRRQLGLGRRAGGAGGREQIGAWRLTVAV
jgi:hypothetical protein